MTKKEIYAYASGIFDGEGSLNISQKIDKYGKYQHWIRLGVTNTNFDILQFLLKQFGGQISKKHLYLGWKPSWLWAITRNANLEKCLRKIKPYSIIKKKQIAIALKYCASNDKKNRLWCREQMLLANNRGRNR